MDFEAIATRCAALSRTRQTEPEAIAEESAAAEVEERQKVGFSARLLVQATLPHSRPAKGVNQFQRSNGFVTVKIIADADYGLPYGTYPRLLLAWMTTEAVHTQSPEMELGASLAEFMRKLDLDKGGG